MSTPTRRERRFKRIVLLDNVGAMSLGELLSNLVAIVSMHTGISGSWVMGTRIVLEHPTAKWARPARRKGVSKP